jgi:RNA:NAD 2'-phosphotransferase (TPT1/KptA family)
MDAPLGGRCECWSGLGVHAVVLRHFSGRERILSDGLCWFHAERIVRLLRRDGFRVSRAENSQAVPTDD